MLGILMQQLPSHTDDLRDSAIGKPVVDDPMLAAGFDETTLAKAGQVVRDLRLRKSDLPNDLAHCQFAVGSERVEDSQPSRMAESAKVLGQQVGFVGRPR